MLGLLLLYWVGKYFYKLAEEHDKSKWGFAILGIVSYYAEMVLFSFIAGIVMELVSPGFVDTMNEMLFGILMIPLGVLCCYIFYKALESSWKKADSNNSNELINRVGENKNLF